MNLDHYDLCVIGGGAAGLVTSGGAAQLGARTLLIEQHRMGGECLWNGCVPSKALLHMGSLAQQRGGMAWADAKRHVDGAIATIAPHDSPERFRDFGVEVLLARATFTGRNAIEADGRRITARRFVIATGSAPMVPPVPGLSDVPFLTNENIFDLTEVPAELLIMGGGAIGTELAQAFARLGSRVTIVERGRLLANSDEEAAALIRTALQADGVTILEHEEVARVDSGPTLHLKSGATLTGTHLLVAAGRAARVEGYGLDRAGVTATPKGIAVDKFLRTSNPKIFAIGDCRDGPRFTHASDQDARAVIANALFPRPLWRKSTYEALPSVVYTAPELAQVGLTEEAARKAHPDVQVHRADLDHNDRAVTEGVTAGFVKLVARGNRLLGATIAGPSAGELLPLARLAVTGKIGLSDIAAQTIAYPTLSDALRLAADSAGQAKLFTPTVRWITRLMQTLP